MAQSPVGRMAAMKDDGFIDFYELLEVEPDATITRLRTTINTLYNESQSNRDHRNLNRRREYQTLLQLLPQARELLLDEKKREKYDAFRDEVQRGTATTSFEEWAEQIRQADEGVDADRTAVLGIQDEQRAAEATDSARVARATPQAAKRPSRVVVGEGAPKPLSPARRSLMGSAISIIVFFVLLLVFYLVLHWELNLALMFSALAGMIAWFATHRRPSNRTPV